MRNQAPQPFGQTQYYPSDAVAHRRCHCKPLKNCASILNVLVQSDRPIPTDLAEQLRQTSCGYASNNEVLVCCPTSEIRYRRDGEYTNNNYREDRIDDDDDHQKWIWDAKPIASTEYGHNHDEQSDDETFPMLHNRFFDVKNSFNLNNYRPHNHNKKTKHPIPKKYIHFDFEDPKSFKNCPPSISKDFELPQRFRDVVPVVVNYPSTTPSSQTEEIPTVTTTTTTTTTVTPMQNTEELVTTEPSSGPERAPDATNLLNNPLCGLSINTRIVGGEDAGPGQFPWMARLAYRNRSKC